LLHLGPPGDDVLELEVCRECQPEAGTLIRDGVLLLSATIIEDVLMKIPGLDQLRMPEGKGK
jgi:hypothetical protein